MTTRLKNILTFTNLAPQASAQLSHSLNIDGVGVIPDTAIPNLGDFAITGATATTLTVTNNGSVTATVNVLVEYFYSPERAFGDPSNPPFTQLTPAPFSPTFAASFGGFQLIQAYTAGVPSIPNNVGTPYETDTIQNQVGANYQISAIAPVGIQILTSGFYLTFWTAEFQTTGGGARRFQLVRGNAGASPTIVQSLGQQSLGSAGGAIPSVLSGAALLQLVALDTISLAAYQITGGNLNVTSSFVTMIKLT